jgi:hypothetical protein
MAFFHVGNTRKRRGFSGLPCAASRGGRLSPQSADCPWKKPSMAFFHVGNPENAEVFRVCRAPHPAATECLHSLLCPVRRRGPLAAARPGVVRGHARGLPRRARPRLARRGLDGVTLSNGARFGRQAGRQELVHDVAVADCEVHHAEAGCRGEDFVVARDRHPEPRAVQAERGGGVEAGDARDVRAFPEGAAGQVGRSPSSARHTTSRTSRHRDFTVRTEQPSRSAAVR